MEEAVEILHRIFGYQAFRGDQANVVDQLLSGGDAFVLMPTGGGKSLCYQIPALIKPGVAVVISPLIALMEDQVSALLQLGVRAAFLNSSLSAVEASRIERSLRAGALDLLYVAPERLMTPRFLSLLESLQIALFAIDEAHCVSTWGHDFRPEYRQLSVLHERFPAIPRVALTATADEPTRQDIIKYLGLENAHQFISSFNRPNIRYSVVSKKRPQEQLWRFLTEEHLGDAGIVYCLSRKRVEEVADFLNIKGREALPYHAGLSHRVRQANQRRFLQEEGIVMVATVAFGMGIDKPNVRFVAHLDMPKSLEGYYQETGRAGRDGLPANAWLAYGLSDVILLRQMLDTSVADESHKWLERRKLEALLGFCESTVCRRQALLRYFGEDHPGYCGYCDNCLEPVATWDGTTPAQMALSCVYRTGQRFGVKHLIDVLLGHLTPQVQRFRHDKVSTFGIGAAHSVSQWQSMYRQLVAAHYLSVDLSGYGGLRLTQTSLPVLRGETTIAFRSEPLSSARSKLKPAASSNKSALSLPPQADPLWQALKQKRLELAREVGVPPYVIFHDSTLLEIYKLKPTSLAGFSTISGVGSRKLERYAPAFLELILESAVEVAI